MTRPVLVTGAGGCIGAWVLYLLHQQGDSAVAFDLSEDRHRLDLLYDDPTEAPDVKWETGDISDSKRVAEVFAHHDPRAVIHLAALQVPYCAADPALGARANVVGCVNVLEGAKTCGSTIAYASSVAATAMESYSEGWKQTVYGAYKVCNEQTARVYWEDAGVPSIGVRPAVVYGAGRDRGMSAAPTFAMLAAALGQRYVAPFRGAVGFVHSEEAASAFIRAANVATEKARVFTLDGQTKTVEEVCEMIREKVPGADVECQGDALPFPSGAGDDDAPLRACIGEYRRPSFSEGLSETIDFFMRRIQQNRISVSDLEAAK